MEDEIDVTAFMNNDGSQIVNAIDAASEQNRSTWLTVDGVRVAAIVPVADREFADSAMNETLAALSPLSRMRGDVQL